MKDVADDEAGRARANDANTTDKILHSSPGSVFDCMNCAIATGVDIFPAANRTAHASAGQFFSSMICFTDPMKPITQPMMMTY